MTIQEAVRNVYDSGSYQRELPGDEPLERSVDGAGWGWLGELFGLGTLGFWIVICALAVGLILWVIIRSLDRFGASVDDLDLPANGATDVTVSTRPLASAEKLAQQGDYAGAIHTLLLGTIDELRSALRYSPSPALTSREILRDCPLSDAGSAALSELIRRVELHYFGTRPPGSFEYRLCVDTFRKFQETCAP